MSSMLVSLCFFVLVFVFFFFFKQKTAYEMCGRDWSSDVCSSDLSRIRMFNIHKTVRNAAAGLVLPEEEVPYLM